MADTRFNVRIGAKDETKGATSSAGKGFSNLGSNVIVANQAFQLLSQTVGPALRGIVSLTTGYVDNGRELLALTRRLGGSVEMWDELRYVGEKYNVTQQAMEMGLQRMSQRLGEVAEFGKGEAAPALEALNMTARDFQGLDAGESYIKLARALAEIPDPARRSALAMKFFGEEGARLVQTMGDGAEGIRKTVEDFRQFGGMTEEEAERAEVLGQKLDLLSVAAKRAKLSFVDGFLGGLGDADLTRLGQMVVKLGEAAGYLAKISQFGIAARILSSLGGVGDDGGYNRAGFPRLPSEFRTKPPGVSFDGSMNFGESSKSASDYAYEQRLKQFRASQIAGQLEGAGKLDMSGLKEAVEVFQADFIKPILESVIDLSDKGGEVFRDATDANKENVALTRRLGEEFGANVIDSAYRAADSWAYFSAQTIIYGGNVFDALRAGLKGLLADILGKAWQISFRSFVSAALRLIPGVPKELAEFGSGAGGGEVPTDTLGRTMAAPQHGIPGDIPFGSPAFAGPSNVNINVTTTFGTRSEAIQVAERVAGAMVEGGFMRRAF